MSEYEYEDIQGAKVRIENNPDDAFIKISADEFATWAVLPQRQRQAAAQALAGDGYDVLPRPGTHVTAGTLIGRVGSTGSSTGPHVSLTLKPQPIDPADVKVGDVVEVTQRSDEMRLRIVVEGEVYKVEDNSRHPFHIRGHGSPSIVGSTEVRLVHRPPEPDPEQVEALYEAIYRTAEGQRQVSSNGDGRADEYRAIADGLARQGVRVQPEEH